MTEVHAPSAPPTETELTANPAPAGSPVSNLTEPLASSSVVTPADDDLGLDRAFLLQLAQIPFIAIGLVLINWGAHHIWQAVAGSSGPNLAPVIVISAGMILCAVIDGWAFRVPNWLTLSLILSGWMLGLLHTLGVAIDAGGGGIGSALMGTILGWALLFPMLAIGGMGHGDVKMQMGFGAWVGAFFGPPAAKIIFAAFCVGAIVGGVFALVMILIRRQFAQNLSNVKQIGTDLKVLVTAGQSQAFDRAQSRKGAWVRLPYGVPLCIGFLGYLAYCLS